MFTAFTIYRDAAELSSARLRLMMRDVFQHCFMPCFHIGYIITRRTEQVGENEEGIDTEMRRECWAGLHCR